MWAGLLLLGGLALIFPRASVAQETASPTPEVSENSGVLSPPLNPPQLPRKSSLSVPETPTGTPQGPPAAQPVTQPVAQPGVPPSGQPSRRPGEESHPSAPALPAATPLLDLLPPSPIRGTLLRGPIVKLERPELVMEPLAEPVQVGQEVALRFMVLSTDGIPLVGALVGANVDRGRILSVREVRPGLVEAVLQAPATLTEGKPGELRVIPGRTGTSGSSNAAQTPSSPPSASLNLVIRATLNGGLVTRSFSLPLRAPVEGWLKLTPATDKVRLGRTREVRLTLQGLHPEGRAIRPSEVDLRTTGGRVERLRSLPDGTLEAWFIPDERNVPQAVVVAAFVGEGRGLLRAWTVLKLIATPEIPVTTEPGARVWVEIGGVTYGPVVADAEGVARVSASVAPGVRSMNIRVMDRVGNSSRTSQSLGIPRAPLSLIRFDRNVFRMDEELPLSLSLIRVEEDGSPVQELKGRLDPRGGSLGGLVQDSPGVFSTTWMPPSQVGRAEVLWSLPLPEGGEERYSASVDVLEGVARRLEFRVLPERLRTDDPPAEVSLKVFDRLGNPATGVQALVEVPVGSVEPLRRIGPGEFITAYRPPQNLEGIAPDADGRVRVPVRVAVQRMAGDGPVTSLEFEALPPLVQAGGPEVRLRVRARNRWGAPVQGVGLRGGVEEGDGSVTERAETDGRGIAVLRFRPGLKVGGVIVQVSTETQPLRQLRTMLVQVASLPREPGADAVTSGRLAGRRDSLDADLAQEVSLELVAGRVRRVELVAFPNVLYMSSNQNSDITVRLLDHSDNLVEDPELKLYASAGSISAPRKSSKGAYYEARYVPPPIALNENRVRLTATNQSGDYSGSTELELVRADGRFITAARLGALSNFGAVHSPVLGFEALARLPVGQPNLYAGFAITYYAFESGTVRLDLAPLQPVICYRRNLGVLSPFILFGPLLVTMSAQRDIINGNHEETLRVWHAGPGVGGRLGLEYQVGLGGVSLELDFSLVRGGSIPALGLDVTQNLGGGALLGGYVAHF